MLVKYVGMKYRSFFGTEPYEATEYATGFKIEDRDGDLYTVYKHGKLEKDWIIVEAEEDNNEE